MKMSTMVSTSISPARRGFFLFITVYLLLAGSSVYAEPNLYNNENFADFANEWQQNCNSGNGWCNGFDYDISGTVDIKDLDRFARLWLTSKDPTPYSDDIAKWTVEVTHPDWTLKWNYDRSFLLQSLYEKWLVDPKPEYLEYIKAWVDHIIQPDGSIVPDDEDYYKISNYTLDHIQPGNLLLYLYELFGDNKYKLAMDNNLIVQLNGQPTTTDGGYWHKYGYKHQMWLDGLYMAQPFACGYAKMFNEPSWYDEAGFQINLIATHTQHSQIYGSGTGLAYHGWVDRAGCIADGYSIPSWANDPYGHSPEYWGRAIGWYAMAIVDCLDIMPAGHSDRDEMIDILEDLAASLVACQDPNGMFYQVVDKGHLTDNWVETSCTLMFSYAFARAVEAGYLPEVPYLAASRSAFESVVANRLTYPGGYILLKGTVSVGSLGGSGGTYYYYVHSGKTDNDIKGVGAFMRAALIYERMTP